MESSLSSAPATLILLVLTTGLSLFAFNSPGLWRFLALEPYRMIATKEYHAIITSGFVHAGFGHLLVNMLTLFFFGRVLETMLGGREFLLIYAVSLIAGSLWPLIKYRNRPDYIAIGASGAISGILFAFCLLDPLRKVYVFFALPMPAILFAVLYTAYSIYAMKRIQDNIGHEAHLAGALGGVVVTALLHPNAISNLIENIF